jgi:hypothetical protein
VSGCCSVRGEVAAAARAYRRAADLPGARNGGGSVRQKALLNLALLGLLRARQALAELEIEGIGEAHADVHADARHRLDRLDADASRLAALPSSAAAGERTLLSSADDMDRPWVDDPLDCRAGSSSQGASRQPADGPKSARQGTVRAPVREDGIRVITGGSSKAGGEPQLIVARPGSEEASASTAREPKRAPASAPVPKPAPAEVRVEYLDGAQMR